jgi:two-component system chemotaxis sensor kinase CheA
MLNKTEDSPPPDPGINEKIIAELKKLLPDSGETQKTEARPKTSSGVGQVTYRIRYTPNPDTFITGMDPLLLLEDLQELGNCGIVGQTENIPELEKIDPEKCYLSWDIVLTTDKGINAIEDIFIFVDDESKIEINEIADDMSIDPESSVPRFGEILIDRGDVSADDLAGALDEQKRLGDLLIKSGKTSREKVKSALQEQQAIKERCTISRAESVRVPSGKLDVLINLVGELVITQAQLAQVAASVHNLELAAPVEETERLTNELRDLVLNIRMMPIGTTFSRFRRLVRDLSVEMGKKIDLHTDGAETELDKTVIDRLADPLVHLIRNSIDHGIELPDDRTGLGKPAKGKIKLSAAHRGASVVITIDDDGRGLDTEKILSSAVKKGLVHDGDDLAKNDIFNLIFAPGFSTAGKVTSVSGRGVGMDVVKREIDNLRGSIDVNSEKNRGTSIRLSLPLTLAIIDGLLVEIEDGKFVIPLNLIEECLELTPESFALSRQRRLIRVRDDLLPYIQLREVFGIRGRTPPRQEAVIVNVGETRVGMVVDRIIGDHQTVIKTLGKLYKDTVGVSGGTILGDGSVALILDVAGLLDSARTSEKKSYGCNRISG